MTGDLSMFVCPECGGPKSKEAGRCATCAKMPSGVVFDVSTVTCPSCGGAKTPAAKRCMDCRGARASSDDRQFPMNGEERAKFGCICTFENANGKTLTIHRDGPPAKALRQACAIAFSHDETFRLVSYSNPSTIFQDLQGARLGGTTASDRVTVSNRASMPEATMLGQISMRALLHPGLAA